jgi:pimeloyl-ACP methyl ester carboxylesterase
MSTTRSDLDRPSGGSWTLGASNITVGNSLGGRIGLGMAAQLDRLHRMVLMGAPASA